MKVAVVGAGLMGYSLALVYVLGGHCVRLTDNSSDALARSLGLMKTALATLRDGGEVDASWTDPRMEQATERHATLEEALAGAELVVEAIVERPDAKRDLFVEIDRHAPPAAIIASNTSALDIFPLVPARRQETTLIAHWYTPPYLVDLCDIVGGPRTDPRVVETVRAIVAGMGKVPVVLKRFVRGYIANRIQAAIGSEVTWLLDEGFASPREIDDAIIHGLALRFPILGHFAKADFTGLLLVQQSMKNASYTPPAPKQRSDVLDRLIADGRTGIMSGSGYFDWEGRSPEELFRERDLKLIALKRALRGIGQVRGA